MKLEIAGVVLEDKALRLRGPSLAATAALPRFRLVIKKGCLNLKKKKDHSWAPGTETVRHELFLTMEFMEATRL